MQKLEWYLSRKNLKYGEATVFEYRKKSCERYNENKDTQFNGADKKI